MIPLIFVNGAPGVGKTTVSKLLKAKLDSPLVEFGWLREFHLNREWTNQSELDEQMSFENLVFILRNYVKYGYSNVIVNDLQEFRTQQIPQLFQKSEYKIFTLVVTDDTVLKNRVLEETRDSGYKNFEKAIEWNTEVSQRVLLKNELRIDTTTITVDAVVAMILDEISK